MRWWDTSSCGVVLNLACAWLHNRSRRRLEAAQRRFHPGVRAWQQTARTAMCGPQWATGGPMSGTVTYRGKLRGWAGSSRACRSRDDQAL